VGATPSTLASHNAARGQEVLVNLVLKGSIFKILVGVVREESTFEETKDLISLNTSL
jgi:hypothetical protein